MKKIIFVVEMLRNGSRENHSYTIGAYDDEILALKEAWEHMVFRAGKYGAVVVGYEINGGARVYERWLDQWDAFAQSCADTAARLKEMLAKDGTIVGETNEQKDVSAPQEEAIRNEGDGALLQAPRPVPSVLGEQEGGAAEGQAPAQEGSQ